MLRYTCLLTRINLASYSGTLPLRVFLAAVGGGAVEGSVRWWARDHRAHHRYTDTDKDPYSVRKGLLYSHFGTSLQNIPAEMALAYPSPAMIASCY